MNRFSAFQVGQIVIQPLVSDPLIESFDSDVRAADHGPGLHFHTKMDELLYIISGRVKVTRGTESILAVAGDVIHIPKRTPHAWKSYEGPAHLLVTFIPGNDQLSYLKELGQLAQSGVSWEEGISALQRKYDNNPCPSTSTA